MSTALANDRLQKRFDKWDADGNGVLERGDFQEEAAKIAHGFGKAPDSREVQALKDAFNGLFDYLAREAGVGPDGSLSKDQFLQVTGNLIFEGGEANFNRVLGPVVKAIIGICDKNDDGKINSSEFEAWLGGIGVNRTEAKEAFQQVDTNGDGELSLDELLAAVREFHFGRLDVELLG
ncbi:EF-hand domain-containing protein [Streptomyces albus]|uniref:EF-hand domain-containing protein n=1 Tax=Streptomyces albus TaxID=1888 RepID=A0A6C1C6L1_9ACTN|nr:MULTISPECIES: EF-hand domain-containing protein [Streptomyces]KPC90978.1 signal transduction protein [Streptomyces sp. NRRL F-6602]EPD93680.1 calerythrin [Streptomyces sp. HPH0547]MDI6408445.1 EF-hand domain-containing protein [Streptomyces albus]QID38658.1 EF-hand domain-containing protein [Streptomyces albus]TGG80429.1 EF-hand domain-containing protein [Streptomyces albus]